MGVNSIPTQYSGCAFRSRLEARWAVFMNTCRIGWDYEPEGLNVSFGGRRYGWLPDFWIESEQWAEVKGNLNVGEAERLLYLASGVGGCQDAGDKGTDVVVMGRIPRQGSARWPVQLHRHGDLWALPWTLDPGCPLRRNTGSAMRLRGEVEVSLLLEGMIMGAPGWAVPGLNAARMARFEFGRNVARR